MGDPDDEPTGVFDRPDEPAPGGAGEKPGARDWVRRVPPGEILFKEGDVDRRVFVLLDGRVQILKGQEPIAEFGVSESFLGEVSALTGKPRWATARTMAYSTLLVVDQIESLFRADISWAMKLAQVLARRLDRTNARLERLHQLLEETRTREGDSSIVETLKLAVADAEKEKYQS